MALPPLVLSEMKDGRTCQLLGEPNRIISVVHLLLAEVLVWNRVTLGM